MPESSRLGGRTHPRDPLCNLGLIADPERLRLGRRPRVGGWSVQVDGWLVT
jgi:hypothetical protein